MAKAPPKVGAPKAKRTPWQGRTAHKRKITGRALHKERLRMFAADPLCQACKKEGRVSVANIRDHIIPLSQGGQDIQANTQGLCTPCHDLKTEQERQEGLKRSRYGAMPV